MISIFRAVALLIFFGAFHSCSVEKNTSLSRNYHNLTSHYNIYFNGRDSYMRGLDKARSSVRYDYNVILPMFLYEEESVYGAMGSDMRRAVDKATKVITVHSITAKPKVNEGNQSPKERAFYEQNEYNKWVDDAYMLMGMAYMYQGEFFLAVETFRHVLVNFPNDEIHFLAMIWLARANIMTGEMREAERILTTLADEPGLPEDYMGALHTTRTQFHIIRENYQPAVEELSAALGNKGFRKEEKIRFTYILGQLYEEMGEKGQAQEQYRRVSRFNPPYEMAFNARVSMAEMYESGGSGSDDLKKLLTKMLRDSKNTEYKDQIYFALGNIAMEEGERDQAIDYYQLSVSSSLQNRYQKGFSSLTLARIYYEEPDYMRSSAYYDSAVSFLNQDFPGYDGLATLSASLGNLVYNVTSYQLEDSVQVLAGMSEEERFAVIDGIIEKVMEEEETLRLEEQQARQDMAFNQSMLYNSNQAGGNQSAQQGGTWYFYNLNAKSFGQPEFRMKWGDRPLEDNWRRKNKQTVSDLSGASAAEGDTLNGGNETIIFDNKSREYYLVNIPLTDSAMQQSNRRLEDALFNMGVIYQENLLDYSESIRAFEELLSRYPDGRYAAQAMYHLYDLNNTIQEQDRSAYYKAQLLSQYPESHYSKLLNNPNYLRELELEEQQATRYYERIYERYIDKDHAGVVSGADSAIALFPDDPLLPKFKYIKALSVGAMSGKEAMKIELDSLVAQHPSSEEAIEAQGIIETMYEVFPVILEADQAQEAEEIYSVYDPQQEHYFLIALHSGENVNQVSFDLLNYNLDHFNQFDLNIERVELNDSYLMLAVKSFSNETGAMSYLRTLEEDKEQFLSGIDPSRYRMMIISRDNFTILSEEKKYNPYYLFYQSHYFTGE